MRPRLDGALGGGPVGGDAAGELYRLIPVSFLQRAVWARMPDDYGHSCGGIVRPLGQATGSWLANLRLRKPHRWRHRPDRR